MVGVLLLGVWRIMDSSTDVFGLLYLTLSRLLRKPSEGFYAIFLFNLMLSLLFFWIKHNPRLNNTHPLFAGLTLKRGQRGHSL